MVKFADFTEPQRPHEVLMFLRQTLHITVDRSSGRQDKLEAHAKTKVV